MSINMFQELVYFRFAKQGASISRYWRSILGLQVMEPKIAFQKLPVFISSDSIPKNKGAMQAIVSLQIVLCEIR